MLSVTKIKFDEWNLIVYYDDGIIKQVDIRDWMKNFNQPSAKRIASDIGYFHKAFIEDGAAIAWPSGFAIEPDEIYEQGMTITKEVASSLRQIILPVLKKLAGI